MLIVLSPAKSLDLDSPPTTRDRTTPRFIDDAAALIRVLKPKSPAEIGALMDISDQLSVLNVTRYADWHPDHANARQAIMSFDGDVYTGLAARTLDAAALGWLRDHVRILSGLYGVLRPLDALQAYRLEMGTRLKTKKGSNLYDFWGETISKTLNAAAEGHSDPTLVNLASQEYFGAVDAKALKLPTVTCHFKEEKGNKLRVLGFFAKKARGRMARYAIDNRIDRVEGLKAFDLDGYRYRPDLSTPADWVFARLQP